MSKEQKRPMVTVSPSSAVTTNIIIHTNNGDIRILAGHEWIIVNSVPLVDVEIHP